MSRQENSEKVEVSVSTEDLVTTPTDETSTTPADETPKFVPAEVQPEDQPEDTKETLDETLSDAPAASTPSAPEVTANAGTSTGKKDTKAKAEKPAKAVKPAKESNGKKATVKFNIELAYKDKQFKKGDVVEVEESDLSNFLESWYDLV